MVSSIFALAKAEAEWVSKGEVHRRSKVFDFPFPWEKWSMEHSFVLNRRGRKRIVHTLGRLSRFSCICVK